MNGKITAREDLLPCDRYLPEVYLTPLWKGDVVYHESILPIRPKDGGEVSAGFVYRPEKILSVRSSDLGTVYHEGVDYLLRDGRLIIPAGSAIPVMPEEAYYPTVNIEGGCMNKTGGGYIRFSEGTFYHDRQIAVTYRHADRWSGPLPEKQLALLPGLRQKLRSGAELRVVAFGDSITTGCNGSAFGNTRPHMPRFDEMVCTALEERYGVKIHLVNTAVGGMTSEWGKETAKERVAAYRPDLVLIAFGMNDGSGKSTPERFEQNLEAIMDTAREANPACEFLLLTSILPNPEAADFVGTHRACYQKALGLRRDGIAAVDIMQAYEYILARKKIADITGNNVNHPNDFIIRLYAQLILAALEE